MRCAIGIVAIGIVLSMSGCPFVSRDEVLRVTSPNGRVDAIVFETDCGAPCSFGYEIRIAPKGSRDGEEVAALDAALRNEHAWGVNLKWVDTDSVSVEYLRADYSTLLKQAVDVGGRKIRVSLNKGVEDQGAPSGGMLFNRH
jgi:hypothetical protein